jgi:hypothetical protein
MHDEIYPTMKDEILGKSGRNGPAVMINKYAGIKENRRSRRLYAKLEGMM